jgi:hypothetical protein
MRTTKLSPAARLATTDFSKSVGMGMVGDSQAAMTELLGHGNEK